MKQANIDFQARNLLTEPWTKERLRGFFSGLPVPSWINPNAPQVKSGEVDVASLTAEQALQLMIENPILIKRPLFEFGEARWCGFSWDDIYRQLGIDQAQRPTADEPEACSHPRAS